MPSTTNPDQFDAGTATRLFAQEHPNWLYALELACNETDRASQFAGRFAGTYVIKELLQLSDKKYRLPHLKPLVAAHVLAINGPSTRRGRRGYYTVPDYEIVVATLKQLLREGKYPRPTDAPPPQWQ